MCNYKYLERCMCHYFDTVMRKQLEIIWHRSAITVHLECNLRVAQREPVQVDGHEQIFPVVQVPPFTQAATQTAKKRENQVWKSFFPSSPDNSQWRSMLHIRVVHVAPPQNVVQAQVLGAVHVPPFWQGDTQIAKIKSTFENEFHSNISDLRIVHVPPVYCDVHEQVLGAAHVPPFWQGDAQIARRESTFLNKFHSILSDLRVVHVAPVHDDVQEQVLGAVHVPPFWQGEVQTATTISKIRGSTRIWIWFTCCTSCTCPLWCACTGVRSTARTTILTRWSTHGWKAKWTFQNQSRSNMIDSRVVHLLPIHCDVQEQMLGAVHVPLFWQGNVQIAN